MITALIAAGVTLVVAIIVVAAVFIIRNRTKTPYAGQKKDVRSVANVGVASSLGTAKRAGGGSAGQQVGSSQPSSKTPSDGLKSRFAAMGVLAAAIFGSLGVKLWSMQVLSSEEYATEAQANKYTVVATPAPRGYIYDANGVAIVKNRSSLTVLADADVVDNRDVVQRLSTVLGIPYNVVRLRIQDSTSGAQSQRVVASDVRLRDVAFITEHADAFPGVSIQTRTVRDYPYGALAAHVVGYAGTATKEQLEAVQEGREIESGDSLGQSGVEAMYDSLLAGDHGQRTVIADAKGNVLDVASETQPTRGSDLYLTIKAHVQYVCDQALAKLIAPKDGMIGTGKGYAGAVVVMDVRDGGVVAMSSYPTFAPETFIGGITQDTWDLYSTPESHLPMYNRAIAGEYPAASTYKAFTGLAALEYGFANTTMEWNCPGWWDGFGSGDVQKCWNHSGHGPIDFHNGIVQSCDIVFYEIGKNFYDNGISQNGKLSDTAMQDEIKKYRFGQATGIDLAGERVGRVPTPEWRKEYYKNYPTEGQWKGGFMTNMAIGQGDVLITPIQLAVAYGALATGNIMKPHVLKEVRNATGGVAATVEAEVVAVPPVKAEHLAVVREALRGVSSGSGDVLSAMHEFGLDPTNVASKTGTGEVAGKADYAFFTAYAPYDNPKYVVACVVEQGGGGGAVGAPLGIEALAAALASDAGTLVDVGKVAGSSGKSQELASEGSGGRTD